MNGIMLHTAGWSADREARVRWHKPAALRTGRPTFARGLTDSQAFDGHEFCVAAALAQDLERLVFGRIVEVL
jgi:hypothetical protein